MGMMLLSQRAQRARRRVEMVRIITGDCLEVMKLLPDASVHCCVTSPPYWGLRDYGVEGQIGLEKTSEQYVEKLVAILREVWRLLRDDGTLWLNLGDSYCSHAGQRTSEHSRGPKQCTNRGSCDTGSRKVAGLKPKDMVGIPWTVAFALRADGWYLRSDVIWAKPNVMPESVTDRPTKAHEYIFLLSKSERYYYDAQAVLEPVQSGLSDVRKMLEQKDRIDAKHFHVDAGPLAAANHRTHIGNKRAVGGMKREGPNSGMRVSHTLGREDSKPNPSRSALRVHGNAPGRHGDGGKACNDPDQLFRNKRSVWTVATSTFHGAHFATFPTDLIAPCILAGCPQGGTVLDPFGGSGTTGEVAERHGRHSVLIELNPKYVELALARTAQMGLFTYTPKGG